MEINNIFPKGFLWGSATASYQVEGGIENCDWAILAKQTKKIPEALNACEHYTRYDADFDIIQSLNQNAHRLSIEWARIEPKEGEFDNNAIEHYRQVLINLKQRGIHRSVTIWHFTLPMWFYEKGGFEKEENIFYFVRYAKKVIESLKDVTSDFSSINEPMVYASNGYLRAFWPPFKRNLFILLKVISNIATAHNEIYAWKKMAFPDVILGIAKNNVSFEGSGFITKKIAKFLWWFRNDRFLLMIKGNVDFIGLNYYFHTMVGSRSKGPFSDMGWEIYPKGIYDLLIDLKKYNVPLYITENGIADERDDRRGDFISQHIEWVHKAIEDGANVKGYYYWSLLDNFEWAFGFSKRFGLIEINYDTMERNIRPSALVYKFICEHNGF
ncbi:MAG: glycoside hydrolase family 1 protein [Candidatus Paceibacterota bacterium]